MEVMDARFAEDRVPTVDPVRAPRTTSLVFGAGAFAEVRIWGPYGETGDARSGFQYLAYRRITRAEALVAAWAWFGVGPVMVQYLDAQGALLAQDTAPFTD